mgnify:CR=1 FL=1
MNQTYYHGGAPGLREILPSAVTGQPSTADYGAEGVCRRDRVYVVNSLAAAQMFASLHPSGKGVVYAVEPIGDLEPDPDFDSGGYEIQSYQCPKAKVLRKIRLTHKQRQLFIRGMSEGRNHK